MSRTGVLRGFSRWRTYFRRRAALARQFGDEPALRAELFSADQMERHGRVLAMAHRISLLPAPDRLLPRLADNEAVLIGACGMLTEATRNNRRITPAAEWLLDNFYLIEEQIRTAQRHLPSSYSRDLPRLVAGPSAGMPRVYDIALEAIAHGDGRVDAESLRRFVASYQTLKPLKLGELWAIPIMLRLALIENLRRVGARVIAEKLDRRLAEHWADQLMDVAERDPKNVVLTVADMARSDLPMSSTFVAEFTRRLLGQGAALALPLTWVEHWLSEAGHTVEHLVQLEAQQQAADQVSIGNSIGSLRELSAIDWREFVEAMSAVERTLAEDPAGTYPAMDFTSRDRYRHVVEGLARRSPTAEPEVARAAVELARAAHDRVGDVRAGHVGFYLLGPGLATLEARIGVRWRWLPFRRLPPAAVFALYLGSIIAVTFAVATALFDWAQQGSVHGLVLALLALPLVLAGSQLAVVAVNWLAALHAPPGALPRMDLSQGIPAAARTLVVVPTLLASVDGVDDLVEALEVRFLANRDRHLHFALLTDFLDAQRPSLAQDEALLERAAQRVLELNSRHAGEGGDRFFLFHRPRRWNDCEAAWIGFERKRGKLADLNALLRGKAGDRFSRIVGDIAVLADVRYVITLDTDTQLPRDAAAQLVGAMEHPLNRPRVEAGRRVVGSGHGILQPRIGISLPSATRTSFARLFGSDAGIDPYTRAVSDTYQDLFDEGSFIGKGIYDVDAFEQALSGRFPDNAILSHDLIEGCFARSGLLSDVQLYEEYPSSYRADVARRHRWIRGDWQLLPWLWPRVPTQSGRRGRNPLSALSRWKMADNLRRSLVAPALLGLLLAGWWLPTLPGGWSLPILGVLLLPSLLGSVMDLLRRPRGVALGQHLKNAAHSARQNAVRFLLATAWLPHEAHYSLDAIARTLWRMGVSRRHMLEWRPASGAGQVVDDGLFALARDMWLAPALALATAAALWPQGALALLAAAPVLLAWLSSPLLSWRLSRPGRTAVQPLEPEQERYLRRLARKTWAFFETFVGPDDHWLPPDNIQEHPGEVVAHRTSPTNMGLALLANLVAHDFGYVSTGRLLARTGAALDTMQSLERFRGHFYNWYDTRSLLPLAPHYVSSVDSGNLAGHLLTLQPGLAALADEPLLHPRFLSGLADTLDLVEQSLGDGAEPGALVVLRKHLAMSVLAGSCPLQAAYAEVQALLTLARNLASSLPPGPGGGAHDWAEALLRQCQQAVDELHYLAPWLDASAAPGAASPLAGLAMPSLRGLATMDVSDRPPDAHAPIQLARTRAAERLAEAQRLARVAGELAQMQFGFLYDPSRHLLAIGYNVHELRLDDSYYDLLASEARLASFVAIAQGQLPQDGWFALGRLLTTTSGAPVLLSWSGSMFEYLMPLLVMPAYEGTLLDQTGRAAVARQIEYGHQRGVPWGVSESGYNVVDAQLTYQYRAFGVPGLGLKRGLDEDLVVAPYASALALMVAPGPACSNLQRLSGAGVEGRFGMYEAVDYTQARLPRGHTRVVIHSFMAHHQGMSLLAFAHVLLDRPMQRRFESVPQFQATSLLLQERVPKTAAQFLHVADFPALGASPHIAEAKLRVFSDPDSGRPAVQLLSNGRYHVMVNSAGSGYSRCRDLAVTRWQEDCTSDAAGNFCYLRDVATGEYWSTSYQPSLTRPASYEAIFSGARAEFRCRERDYDVHADIVVSPEDDIELRRVTVLNRSRSRRTIELTSYAEVVLAPAMADALHPAFSKLFVQTELVRPLQAILCTRRPRSVEERAPWLCHLMAIHDAQVDSISYETDRSRFIGRGNSVARPAAMATEALSDAEGSVLDPIVAIRCRITLAPEQSATIDIVTGVGDSREACLGLVEKYRDRRLADRVFDLAWTHNQVMLRQLNISQGDAQLFERLAGSILYATPAMRADPGVLASNRRGQSGLWGQAISGDLPVVLLKISDAANIDLVRQMVQAQAYWRLKGLAADLVIWNDDRAGYRQHLNDLIMGLVASGSEASLIDKPGGIFVRPAHQLSNEERMLMQAVARIIISDDMGSLAEQIGRRPLELPLPRQLEYRGRRPDDESGKASAGQADVAEPLLLGNGIGGFSADGREYVIRLGPGDTTPAPWANVIANGQFGTVVSESGGAYTWAENAHEFRLTPWHDDPVSDASGEAFYLRDEETGVYWSPMVLPCRGRGSYVVRHGFGYSVFEHAEDGIESELRVHVALDAAVKFWSLTLRNASGRPRRLSATGYVEWVLGDLRAKNAMHVVSEMDGAGGSLLARNAYNAEFAGRVAFFDGDTDRANRSITGDRSEFLGRNRSLRSPAAMARTRLSGRFGAGMDPCAAIRLEFDLAEGEQREIVFRLGSGRDRLETRALIQRFRLPGSSAVSLQQVREHWERLLGTVQVRSPDPALDVLANGWLLYQTIACRFLARSGYYQSGGAFGFRDQLQDAMAMVHVDPQRVRDHLLLCAAHQFPEGDVQHWWHPPIDRGVRTRCSDDYLWLPLATSRYVAATGDIGVLDEVVGYIEGRPMAVGEESYYDLPVRSVRRETLYQHCERAIANASARGAHGLPLIGSGDWNDGMNKVGEHGRGESVWLAFFLCEVLARFADLAAQRQDAAFAERCLADVERLRANIEAQAWDGAWYRRAFDDEGRPLGSDGNEECRIDSIAQSWSVLSGVADGQRARQAMRSLEQRLLRRDTGIVQLLDPPFDTSATNPGYIKGYLPGVRENGGQYTHAAIWAAMAFARLGDRERAWEVFDMINPVNHGRSAEAIAVYKVEPFVVAADVYARAPHVGRGGWTWYTGSAGWMYRLIVESLLGLQVEHDRLRIRPVIRPDWPAYEIRYRFGKSIYRITVTAVASSQASVTLDGAAVAGDIALRDDGLSHEVHVRWPVVADPLAKAEPNRVDE